MDSIQKLYDCAYNRGVGNLQHRTLLEFAIFIENVIWSKDPEYEKYQFEWNGSNAIEIWIDKFHEYRKEQSKIEQESLGENY